MAEKQESILIVDDEDFIRRLLRQKLTSEGYNCHEASNAQQAVAQLKDQTFGLIILDNKMPGIAGIDLLPELASQYPDMAIIMATATNDISIAIHCMKIGAYDYITKPFNLEEVVISVERALEKRRLILENSEYRQHLEDKVKEQTRKIRALSLNAITSLVNALEAKDNYTSGHSQRVSSIAVGISRKMELGQDEIDRVRLAGLVHDIGKIGVSDLLIRKPSRLSDSEYKQFKEHPEVGEHILAPITDDVEILKMVRHHHEHFDGSGYPDGLKGSEIPLGARILAVADAWEAMTSERAYRATLTKDTAKEEMRRCERTQFDPDIAEIFLNNLESILSNE